MLAKLASRQFFKFSEAIELNLYQPHIKKYFEGDIAKVQIMLFRFKKREASFPRSTISRRTDYNDCSN